MVRAITTSEPQRTPPHAILDPELLTPAATDAVSHDDIARRAYELYLAHGSLDGFDKEDWLEAERMLAAEAALTRGRA